MVLVASKAIGSCSSLKRENLCGYRLEDLLSILDRQVCVWWDKLGVGRI